MKQKNLLIAIVLLMSVIAVHAQEEQTIKMTLKQAEGNKEVKDVLVNIGIFDKQAGDERTISSFIRSNPITLRLPQGDYVLSFKIDNLQTAGKDFYGKQEINLENSTDQEITVFPVGSLKGVVYDTLNNLVSKATLKVECSKEYGEKPPEFTDKVGSFSIDYAPIGECTITATSHDAVGRGKITIDKGASQNIEIRLDRAVISEGGNGWIIFFGVIIMLALGGAGWYGWRYWKKTRHLIAQQHTQKKPEEHKEKAPEEKLSKRTQDILNTLNDKETKIVTFLLNSNHHSTQAKIRYETGIPKTTLVRVFMSLQNKKVVSIETMGKLKKIKLTQWFLDKEN